MSRESENLAIVRRYLTALGSGDGGDALAYYAEEIVQEEYPNRLTPQGARRDLTALREAAQRGAKVMTAQTYEILNEIPWGDKVAVEVQWTGTLAVPVGSIPAGGQMRARFAIFIELRDGKIIRQGNYDCFDPF